MEITGSPQLVETSANFVGSVKAKLAAVVMTSCLVLGACGESTPTTEVVRPTAPAQSLETQHCYDPSAAELAEASDMLDQATINNKQHRQNHPKPLTDPSQQAELFQRRHEAAQENGLTVYNYYSIFEDLINREVNQDDSVPYATYFDRSRTFLKYYGIDLELGQGDQELSGNYELGPDPSGKELENINSKSVLLDLVASVGKLPVEHIKAVPVKAVRIVNIKTKHIAGFVGFSLNNNTIYLDSSKAQGNIFNHETAHLIDFADCGSDDVNVDESFNNANPGNVYGNKDCCLSREEFLKQNNAVFVDPDQVDKSGMTSDDYAKNVVTISDYAEKNVVEDKAETGTGLTDPVNLSAESNRKFPFLRQKYEILLARLNHYQPKVAKYLIDISN